MESVPPFNRFLRWPVIFCDEIWILYAMPEKSRLFFRWPTIDPIGGSLGAFPGRRSGNNMDWESMVL